jgi:hypothetical protein
MKSLSKYEYRTIENSKDLFYNLLNLDKRIIVSIELDNSDKISFNSYHDNKTFKIINIYNEVESSIKDVKSLVKKYGNYIIEEIKITSLDNTINEI